MDILTSIIFIILFIVMMVFIFSMGLLAPMIGKKGLVSVLVISFIIGLVAGAYFLSPLYEELPYVIGSTNQAFNGESEIIDIDLSTKRNASNIIKNLSTIKGVNSVKNNGIFLETSKFSEGRKKIIEDKVAIVDENFKSWNVDSNGIININITEGYDANEAIAILSEWLMYSAGIQTKYSLIKIQIYADASESQNVLDYLESQSIVVSSVKGPVHDSIENTKKNMPDRNVIIFLCGILGLIIGLIGVYFDETRVMINDIKTRINNRTLYKINNFKDKIDDLRNRKK